MLYFIMGLGLFSTNIIRHSECLIHHHSILYITVTGIDSFNQKRNITTCAHEVTCLNTYLITQKHLAWQNGGAAD